MVGLPMSALLPYICSPDDDGKLVLGDDGKPRLVGDVEFDGVSQVVSAITPVPGGVGPLTVIGLMLNTVDAYKLKYQHEMSSVTF